MPVADREQAHYFDGVLSGQRAERDRRLDGLYLEVTRLDGIGDAAGVRHKRRLIRSIENEVRTIDRMQKALRLRLEAEPLSGTDVGAGVADT
ncbi:MAG: hypothetical protein JOZ49_17220 [Mycolicibacterium sp.]|nr:hypothetical protein [Mycolicibacterium sp.]